MTESKIPRSAGLVEAVDRILIVDSPIVQDTSIQKENLISIFPSSGSSLNQHGEINFIIETCDQYLLLHKSYIYLEASLTKLDSTALAEADEVTLSNNAPMFLFDRATYSMDGMQVENVIDPGRASLMKGLLTYSSTMNKKILSRFQIGIEYQQIYDSKNSRIDLLNGSLEGVGLKDNETLILKHSGLHNWAACLVFADSVAQKKPDHLKAKFAKRGSKILIDLENCEFFDTYPSFADKFVELSTVFDRFIIGVEENIKIAVGSYFRKYFANEALSITFSPKPDTGAQGGFIVHVADADYFVKNHTFIGRGSAHSRVDKREIFVYRLLQFIGVGADAHFIPSAYSRCYTSALALHIATKRVQGFHKRALRSACPFTDEHQMRLDLIGKLLYLGDLNSGNYGLDDKHQLIIIDFTVIPQESCIHSATLFEQRLYHPSLNMIIKNWKLLENFTKATESIANDCKRMENIIWRDGYDEYLKVVLENIKLLNNML